MNRINHENLKGVGNSQFKIISVHNKTGKKHKISLTHDLLIEQELSNSTMGMHHLVKGRNHARELTLTLVLLVQELSSQVINQMVVVELGFTRVLADSNNVTDVVGHASLKLQGILKSTDAINPGGDIVLGARVLDEVTNILGQLTTHQQVLNELDGVFTLFTGRLEKVGGKSRTVDSVLREVGGHGKVGHGGGELGLDLLPHLLHAGIDHGNPFLGDISSSELAFELILVSRRAGGGEGEHGQDGHGDVERRHFPLSHGRSGYSVWATHKTLKRTERPLVARGG